MSHDSEIFFILKYIYQNCNQLFNVNCPFFTVSRLYFLSTSTGFFLSLHSSSSFFHFLLNIPVELCFTTPVILALASKWKWDLWSPAIDFSSFPIEKSTQPKSLYISPRVGLFLVWQSTTSKFWPTHRAATVDFAASKDAKVAAT